MKYLAWKPESQTRRDAIGIEAETARDAAERFASEHWEPKDGDSIDVKVLPIGAVQALLYVIDIDIDISMGRAVLVGRVDAEREEVIGDL